MIGRLAAVRKSDATTRRRPRREQLAKLSRYEDGLARGRRKGADMQRLAAVLRRNLVDQAVSDLLRTPEASKWRHDVIVRFVFDRQREIGLHKPYSFSTLDRIVRKSISKAAQTAASAIRKRG